MRYSNFRERPITPRFTKSGSTVEGAGEIFYKLHAIVVFSYKNSRQIIEKTVLLRPNSSSSLANPATYL
ncbi:MAG: hypothetical protein LBT46_14590 [Planctomycetaceae bacterium]|nr:hypothetical protein [Planctomycetaceae bacterium]